MGDRWRLLLGEQQILWGKNSFPSRLMTIFQEQDKYMREDWARALDELNSLAGDQVTPEALEVTSENRDEMQASELFGYRTKVGTALSRLKLMGFTPEASRQAMAEIRRSRLREDLLAEDVLYVGAARGRDATSHRMSCEQVVETGLDAFINGCTSYGFSDDLSPLDAACLEELELYFEDEKDDPRFLLSALLKGQDAQKLLTMDLSDLLAAGYCSSTEDLSAQAGRELSITTVSTGPIIVITEGKFDSQVLPRGIQLVRPDIAGYFRFWDLESTKAAGGTDQVVKNLRSFAAAGVMNRVIGILDNDTAGRQAEKQLGRTILPENFAVCRLPDVDYGHSYPTLGPSGASQEDVTGRACSVEFYFGKECLREKDGNLAPVRWKSYIEAMSDYQGELVNKASVQERIEEKLRLAERGGRPLDSEWDSMRKIAQVLVDLAAPEPGLF
ncbi:hypothetical protein GCM10010464_35990 [Pseudonocardia yunnanensis]|uniref:HEPN/Toprim-associated domain-containing protein n=1 Tax=Pseudonocardia yunnanensis TaxID=58107 RepID=A0ABW4ENT9_9PSEU